MHTYIGSEEDPTGAICLDRKLGTCVILLTDVREASKLAAIARAQKVPSVKIMVPDQFVAEMEAQGFRIEDTIKVMSI